MKKLLAVYASGLGHESMGKLAFQRIFNVFNAQNPNTFELTEWILHNSDKMSFIKMVTSADLIIFVTSPYHFYLQSWMVEYLNSPGVSDCLNGKTVAGFISSAGLFEKICESQLRELMTAYGAKYLSGYSCIEYDMIRNDGIPADFKKRTGNNIDDIIVWLEGLSKAIQPPVVSSSKILLVTTLSHDDPFYTKCYDILTKMYESIQCEDLYSYNVAHCTACKACYTNKKCCMHDDFEKYERLLKSYDEVFFVIDMKNRVLNPLFTKFMQREVHNGLYPEQPKSAVKWTYLIESNNCETQSIRTYFDIFSSFGRLFCNVFIDDEIHDLPSINSIMAHQRQKETMANMTCYTRFTTWHFKNLAKMLRNLLLPEYKYFRFLKYCDPPKINRNAGPIFNIKDAQESQKHRLMELKDYVFKYQKDKK